MVWCDHHPPESGARIPRVRSGDCGTTDDWRVQHERGVPPEVWDFVKHERFFGLIIAKKFGAS